MLRFTSMTVENAGPYIGKQTIDFQDGKGVSIIWGENGFGKTTLLNLFRYALFGRFQNRQGATIDVQKMVNADGEMDGKYGLKVVLNMDYDGKDYVLTRQFSVREGVNVPSRNDDYVQNTFLKVDGALLSKNALEHELKKIMPEAVSRFFLFDGELLQDYENLLDESNNDGEKIKKAIETILGVPILTNGELDTAAMVTEQEKARTKVATSKKNTQIIASQIDSETALMEAEMEECSEYEADLNKLYDERDQLEQDSKQNEHINDLIQQMKSLEGDIREKESRRDALLQLILTQTKEAWKGMLSKRSDSILAEISEELSELDKKKASQDSIKQLLSYMGNAADNGTCDCCGQSVDEIHAEKIRQRMLQWQSKFVGLSDAEIAKMQELRARQSSLKSMHTESNAASMYNQIPSQNT